VAFSAGRTSWALMVETGLTIRARHPIVGGERPRRRGNKIVAQQRLYQLVRQPRGIADRTFEITFLAPGVEAYVFTFG
jgi:thioredoxin family protein